MALADDKVRFLVTGVLDDATHYASSVVSGLFSSHVSDELIRKVYKTTGKENEWVHLQVDAVTGIDTVFVGNHNFTKNATVLWQGNSTSDFSSGPALSIALAVATDGMGNVIARTANFSSAIAMHDHWRLYVEDSTNALTNLQIGRIMAGRAIEPMYNSKDGFTERYIDPSRTRRTAGRQGYKNVRPTYMEYSYSVGHASRAQQDEMVGIYNTVGKHTAFVFSLQPKGRPIDSTIYAEFESPNLGFGQTILENADISELLIQEKN